MSTADRFSGESVLDDGMVQRMVQAPSGEIALVAVQHGGDWKVTVEGAGPFRGLEFHGPLPKTALDLAESFVRRLIQPAT
jgi:hypothetical protein